MNRRVLLPLLFAMPLLAADPPVEEKFDSGKVRSRFAMKDGKKHGPFTTYYENGKVSDRGEYKDGNLHGEFTVSAVSGKVVYRATYKEGVITGTTTDSSASGAKLAVTTYRDGKPVSVKLSIGSKAADQDVTPEINYFARPLVDMQRALSTVAATPLPTAAGKKQDAEQLERFAALQRLRSYRAAVGVPIDVSLDAEHNAHAKAGAELLQKIGKLDHTPPNPGWPEDKYKFAYKGTSSSNIFSGSASLSASVDAYMNDSDPSNIEKVGHRRWCLNPFMGKTGFGKSPNGNFSAMWSFDQTRKDVPNWEFVAYPTAGIAPLEYFGPRYAWSVSPNPAVFRIPANAVINVKLYRKNDKSVDKLGDPVETDYNLLDRTGFGSGPAFIFRPKREAVEPGKKFVVVIDGLTRADGKPGKIQYMVVFANVH